MKHSKKPARWLVVAFVVILTLAVSSAALAAEFAGDQTYRLAEGETDDDDLYIADEIALDSLPPAPTAHIG